jgi:3-oxoacyl-[acyl-carrier-protein] synthase III
VHIAAFSYQIPLRRVTNEDVIANLDRYNATFPSCRRMPTSESLTFLYNQLRAETRYVRDIAKGEKAADLILRAMDEALNRANMVPTDIDLLQGLRPHLVRPQPPELAHRQQHVFERREFGQ